MKSTELLNTQTSVNETNKQDSSETTELIKREPVEGTPFTIIEDEEGHYLTMGRYRLTEKKETKEEALEQMGDTNWNFLTAVIGVMSETLINANNKEILNDLQNN